MFNVTVFRSVVFVFPIVNMLAFNIVVVILGPIILISLAIWKNVILARHDESGNLNSRFAQFRNLRLSPQTLSFYRWNRNPAPPVPKSKTDRLIALWVHGKFWIALVVTLGLDALLVFLYTVVNPFVSLQVFLSMPSLLTNVFFL